MQQFEDENGLSFTVAEERHAEKFARIVTSYMGARRDTSQLLDDLLLESPTMPMAVCAKGYFSKLVGSGNHSRLARSVSATLDALIEDVGANKREQLHAQALSCWCKGDLDGAVEVWENILLDFPMDGLALRLTHFLHLYSGDGRRIRDSVARVLPLWPEDHSDYGFLLGMYAFGLEETAEYARAEEFGRKAVAMDPSDAWSVHAVAHVLEMTGRQSEGIDWLAGLEGSWSSANNFRFHLWWHRCLYHLELGEYDAVFDIYDNFIVSDIASDFYLDICNAASLLWRLEMHGLDAGDRWGALAEVSKNHIDDDDMIFVSLHYLMALVSAGQVEAGEAMLATIRHWAERNDTQGKVCRDVGLALAEALDHARAGDPIGVVEKIRPVRYGIDAIGGSKAQRDVFFMIMLEAAMQHPNVPLARSLVAEFDANHQCSEWAWGRHEKLMAQRGSLGKFN